ncbi:MULTISPECIES: hypothetical protein [Streptomyces]|uniref:Uncharacterized protein n=2 Tax=Streptomyces TaxID=1883 RepID=A0A100YA09_9ACTN|nr:MULTISPECIES: hypothetical protein [Streptomyces]KUH40344.1 hypothetical protein ATE80_01735 [Streptomyces kanasensis]UUS29794.1 hypothetical protein NRO40_02385 [Streptomyces changanensis]
MRDCEEQTGTNCGGFVTIGSTLLVLEDDGGASKTPMIRFTILSFRSTDDAKVALKGMAAEQRQGWADVKPLKISAGADETDAFTGEHTEVMMRLGGALIRMESMQLKENEPYGELARLQVDRLKKTMEGENPDA